MPNPIQHTLPAAMTPTASCDGNGTGPRNTRSLFRIIPAIIVAMPKILPEAPTACRRITHLKDRRAPRKAGRGRERGRTTGSCPSNHHQCQTCAISHMSDPPAHSARKGPGPKTSMTSGPMKYKETMLAARWLGEKCMKLEVIMV